MRRYIIKSIDDIIEFYPELTKLPVPDSFKEHIIILISTKHYNFDFGKSIYFILNFNDVSRGEEGFINEQHINILKEIIKNLENIDLVIVGCDAGFSRSPAVAAAIARCVGDETETRGILDTYQYLNIDVFDTIVNDCHSS